MMTHNRQSNGDTLTRNEYLKGTHVAEIKSLFSKWAKSPTHRSISECRTAQWEGYNRNVRICYMLF